MATTVSISTTYNGQYAGKIISAGLLSARSISDNLVTVRPNVAFKEVLKVLNTDDIVKDNTCDWDPTSTISLTQRVLEVNPYQVQLQVCKSDFMNDYLALEQGFSAHNVIPASFSDYLIGYAAEKVASHVDKTMWSGSAGLNGQWAGFQQIAQTAGSGVVSASLANAATASSTVISAFEQAMNVVSSTVYGKDDFVIAVNPKVYRAYQSALAAQGNGYMQQSWVGSKPADFLGTRIALVDTLPDNRFYAYRTSNALFGTGLLSDHNEVKLIDTSETLGDNNVRLSMKFTAGCQIAIPTEFYMFN